MVTLTAKRICDECKDANHKELVALRDLGRRQIAQMVERYEYDRLTEFEVCRRIEATVQLHIAAHGRIVLSCDHEEDEFEDHSLEDAAQEAAYQTAMEAQHA